MEVLDPAACHRQVSSPRTLATQAGSGDLGALVLAPHPAELGPRPLRGLIAASAVVSIVCSTSVCESRLARRLLHGRPREPWRSAKWRRHRFERRLLLGLVRGEE